MHHLKTIYGPHFEIIIYLPVVAIDRSSVENFEVVRAYPDLMSAQLDDQGHRDHQNSDVAFQASVVSLDFPLNDLNSFFSDHQEDAPHFINDCFSYPFQLVRRLVVGATLDLDLVYPAWVDFVGRPLVELSPLQSVNQVLAM